MADCPRCLVERLRPPEGEHDACPCLACRGAWLPAPAARRLVANPFGPLESLPRIQTGSNALRCPECRAELTRHRVARVEIDLCSPHGVWFDHQEIDRVRAAAEQHRRGELSPVVTTTGLTAAATITAAALSSSPATRTASDTVSNTDAALAAGDVGLAVLELVDTGEVASGAFEVLAGVFEALFSGL
ncbi:zf-TFIIB domain-containing protein [Nannocystis sp.]|uniref:zf-TFIIB domain-containing protein n=1 Tax=Nannocystis sp. TaxID=1962667 RepID=UPI0024260753|nr:zf-TFIIB domain-containing protein [Nannocystis sp.]MBK7826280.1 zf-TFIIB domain-containing protein [Nannocystis sp.]MBK9758207.1 zf-TFIIB domain-containing protein [Nannocystis sp.]